MRERKIWIALFLSAGAVVALLICTGLISVPAGAQGDDNNDDNDNNDDQHPPAVYNPYPPGILPSDLNSELARVLREVDFIEERALAQWRALTPPVLTRSRASK